MRSHSKKKPNQNPLVKPSFRKEGHVDEIISIRTTSTQLNRQRSLPGGVRLPKGSDVVSVADSSTGTTKRRAKQLVQEALGGVSRVGGRRRRNQRSTVDHSDENDSGDGASDSSDDRVKAKVFNLESKDKDQGDTGCSIYYLGITGFLFFFMAACLFGLTVLVPGLYVFSSASNVYLRNSELMAQDVARIINVEMSRVSNQIEAASADIESTLANLRNDVSALANFWDSVIHPQVLLRANSSPPYTNNFTIETIPSPYATGIPFLLPSASLPPTLSMPIELALESPPFLTFADYINQLNLNKYSPFAPIDISNTFGLHIEDWVLPTVRKLIPRLGCSNYPRSASASSAHFASITELAVSMSGSDHSTGVKCHGGNGFSSAPTSLLVWAVFSNNLTNYHATASSASSRYATLEYWEWVVPLATDPLITLFDMSCERFLHSGTRYPVGSIQASNLQASSSRLFAFAKKANSVRYSRAKAGLSPVPNTFRVSAATPGVFVFVNDIGCNNVSCIDYGTLQQLDTSIAGMVVGVVDVSGDFLKDACESVKKEVLVETGVTHEIFVVDSDGFAMASTAAFEVSRSYSSWVLSARAEEGIIQPTVPRSAVLHGWNYDHAIPPTSNYSGFIPGYSYYASVNMSGQQWALLNLYLPANIYALISTAWASYGAKMRTGDFNLVAEKTTTSSTIFESTHDVSSLVALQYYGLIVFAVSNYSSVRSTEINWIMGLSLAAGIAAAVLATLYFILSFVVFYPLLRARNTIQCWLWREAVRLNEAAGKEERSLCESTNKPGGEELIEICTGGSGKEIELSDTHQSCRPADLTTLFKKPRHPWLSFLLTPLVKEVYSVREAFLTMGEAIFESSNVEREIQLLGSELSGKPLASALLPEASTLQDEVDDEEEDGVPLSPINQTDVSDQSSTKGAHMQVVDEQLEDEGIATLPPIGSDLAAATAPALPANSLVRLNAVILTFRIRVSSISGGRRERLLRMFRLMIAEEERDHDKWGHRREIVVPAGPTRPNEKQLTSPSGAYSIWVPSTAPGGGRASATHLKMTAAEVYARSLSRDTEALKRLQNRVEVLIAKEHYIINDFVTQVLPHYHGEVISIEGNVVTAAFATHRGDGQVLSLSDIKSLSLRCVDFALSRYVKAAAHRPPSETGAAVWAAIAKHSPEDARTLQAPSTNGGHEFSSHLWRRKFDSICGEGRHRASSAPATPSRGRIDYEVPETPCTPRTGAERSSAFTLPRRPVDSGTRGFVKYGGTHTVQGATEPRLPLCPFQVSSSKYILAALDVSTCYRVRLGSEGRSYVTLFGEASQRCRSICDFQRSNFSYIPIVCSDDYARLLAPSSSDSLLSAATVLGVESRLVDAQRSLPLFTTVELENDEPPVLIEESKGSTSSTPRSVPHVNAESITSVDSQMKSALTTTSFLGGAHANAVRVQTGPYYCPHHDNERCPRFKGKRTHSPSVSTRSSTSETPPPLRMNVLPPPAFGTHQHCAICGCLPHDSVEPSLDVATVPVDVLLSTVSVGLSRKQGVLVHAVLTQQVLQLDHANSLGALAGLIGPAAVPLRTKTKLPPVHPQHTPSLSTHQDVIMRWFEDEIRASDALFAAFHRKPCSAKGEPRGTLELDERSVACDATVQLLSVQQFPAFLVHSTAMPLRDLPLVDCPPVLGGSPFHTSTKGVRPMVDPPYVQFYRILTSIADGRFSEAIERAVSLLTLSEHIKAILHSSRKHDVSVEAFAYRQAAKALKPRKEGDASSSSPPKGAAAVPNSISITIPSEMPPAQTTASPPRLRQEDASSIPLMLISPIPDLLCRRLLQLIQTSEIQLEKRRKQLGVEAVSREIAKSLGRGVDHERLLLPPYKTDDEEDSTSSASADDVPRFCPLYARKVKNLDVMAREGAPDGSGERETPRNPTYQYVRNTQVDHGPEGLYRKQELFGWEDAEMMQFFDLNDAEMRERFEDALSSQDLGSLLDEADAAMETQHRQALGELQAAQQLTLGMGSVSEALIFADGKVRCPFKRSISPCSPREINPGTSGGGGSHEISGFYSTLNVSHMDLVAYEKIAVSDGDSDNGQNSPLTGQHRLLELVKPTSSTNNSNRIESQNPSDRSKTLRHYSSADERPSSPSSKHITVESGHLSVVPR